MHVAVGRVQWTPLSLFDCIKKNYPDECVLLVHLLYEDVLKGLESAIAFAILPNNNINITIIKPVLVSCLVLQLSVWEA